MQETSDQPWCFQNKNDPLNMYLQFRIDFQSNRYDSYDKNNMETLK